MQNRWIMYASQVMPGNTSFRLSCHQSLDWCKDSLAQFSREIYADDVYATLYPFTEEMWAEARKYEETGCPFDYPSKIIERGPRGALRIISA